MRITWQVATWFETWSKILAQNNNKEAAQELGRLREVWWQGMWIVARDTRLPGEGLYEMYNQRKA